MSSDTPGFGGTIQFKKLMKELNKNLTKLSDLTIEMIVQGQKALVEDDEKLYRKLKQDLEEVHELCYALEDTIVSSLALHQPFAGDLRYILSTLRIMNEIHRSAHDAVHIAKSTKYIDQTYQTFVKRIGKLSEEACELFSRSITAFKNRKELDLEEWRILDDEIDEAHKQIIKDIAKKIEEDPSWARAGMSLTLATRYIERIADHACNIVEESYYVVTGKRGKIL